MNRLRANLNYSSFVFVERSFRRILLFCDANAQLCDILCALRWSALMPLERVTSRKFAYSRMSRSSSAGHIPHSILSAARAERTNNPANERDAAKLQVKKRKTEDAVKKAEVEYYNVCVQAERARWIYVFILSSSCSISVIAIILIRRFRFPGWNGKQAS